MTFFSQRLRWLREKQNMTQKEMAEKIDVSQQYYNKFEKGTGQPNLETLFRIRHVLGESLDFIIGYHLEDYRAENLFELYVETRSNRHSLEEDIEYINSTSDEEHGGIEKKIKLLKKFKDDLRDETIREQRAFNDFFEYIKTIPGCEGKFAEKEFWIKRYDTVKDREKKLYQEFWEEYEKLANEKEPR